MNRPFSFWRSPLALSIALLGATTGAHAATFTVFNTNDSGEGSLRQAVASANADTDANSTIVFSNEFGQVNNPQTIALSSGVLLLTHNTNLVGPGARSLVIAGSGNASAPARVFNIQGASVSISGVSITGGFSNSNGGAILNNGTLRLSQSMVSNSTAAGNGGALYNSGTLTVGRCTFAGNSATSGGGLYTIGTATVNASTFGVNTASSEAGGGIYNDGTLTLSDSTVSRNTATTVGGGLFNGNRLSMTNTIVGGNSATGGSPNISGPVQSGDFNLVGDTSGTTLPGTHNVTGRGPLLGDLGNNGGPTDTFVPQPGSPAIDAGQSVTQRDQRSTPRPIDLSNVANTNGGNGSDIGAVELDTPQSVGSLVVNTFDDHTDGTCGVSDCSLREAVGASRGENSVVTFAPKITGTLTLSGTNIDLSRDGDGVTLAIQGPGVSVLTLSGGGKSNVFGDNTSSGTANISGLTFSGGEASNLLPGNAGGAEEGGAIDSDGMTLNIADCVFAGNHSTNYGGAIDADGDITLTRCAFSNNASDSRNGAVGFYGDASSATDCTFSGNSAKVRAGALYMSSSAATVTRCTFTNNKVVSEGGNNARGGALYSTSNDANIIECRFNGNSVTATATAGNTPGIAQGAAIYNNYILRVLACTLSGNGGAGVGAILNDDTLTLRNSTLTGNGDAVRMESGTSNIIQNTIVGNTRGVVGSNSATLTVNRCTIAGNVVGLNTRDAQTTLSNTLLVGNQTNLIGTAMRSFNLLNVSAAQAGLQTDANGQPLLKDNGGPTATVALLAGSPAINQADPGITDGFDQRQAGFPRVSGGRADIGAFELQSAQPSAKPSSAPSAPRS